MNPRPRSDDARRSPRRRRLDFDRRVLVLALSLGAPGVAASLLLVWLGPFAEVVAWTVTVVLLVVWLVLAFMLRDRVVRPVATLANVLASFGEGDFSMRFREEGEQGALGLAYRELNALEAVLREQRLGAVEASILLQRVMAEIDVAVFAFDEGGRLRLLNRAAERLLGRDEKQVIGETASSLRLSELLAGRAPRTVELSHPGSSGRWELRRNVVRQEGQRLDLLVLSDLSRALREEERQAWKRIVRVLGHEINNSLAPIKSISGSLAALLDRRPRPEDRDRDLARGLDVIRKRAETLSRFMASYAEFARLPAPTPAPMEVGSWVRHAARIETRVPVTIRPGPAVTLHADRDQLEQVLINLVRNAADAVSGDEVLHASENGEGPVTVGWSVRDGSLRVDVEDDGPGLPDSGNLFVPFYTTKPGGSGIGLVLSRQIVEHHGGRLILDDRPGGRGARARIVLPLRPAP